MYIYYKEVITEIVKRCLNSYFKLEQLTEIKENRFLIIENYKTKYFEPIFKHLNANF